MDYDNAQEVKEVEVTALLRVKMKITLLGVDYNESDGTDAGAAVAAFAAEGFPDWEEMSLYQILSVYEV